MYSPSGYCSEFGKADIGRITRLCYHLYKLQSKFSKVVHNHQRKRRMAKAMTRMRKRIKNLVKELHVKLVNWLLSNHRIVLLPKFQTSWMVKRGRRKIGSKTARAMLTWSHCKFQERLKFKAKEYPWSRVYIVDESYTSKTCTRCGNVKYALRGEKTYRCDKCRLVIERDVAGARNILIKYLTDQNL
jgi:putative transposase